MDALHELSLELLKALSSQDEKVIGEMLEKYKLVIKDFPDLLHTNIDKLDSHLTSKHLKQIGMLLQIKFKMFVIVKGIQEMKETNFVSMLNEISKHNIHKIVIKGQVYKCDYHLESLFTHLVLAMLTTLAYLPHEEVKDEEKKLQKHVTYGLTALLHDIGKYGCVGALNIKDKKWTHFPFHGEMGSGIMQQAYNEEFARFISKDEWEIMARTVCVHMCGYHEHNPDIEQTKYKWSLLQLESEKVKEILYPLSIADHLAAIRKKGQVKEIDHKVFMESRILFKNFISQTEFDNTQFMKKYTLNGMILMICGMSSAGKSTITSKIVTALKKFGVDMCVIERDDVLTRCVAKFLKETVPLAKITGETYLRYRKVYEEKKLSNIVNKTMSSEIDHALKSGKFVIIDTVMNIFKGIEHATPDAIKKALKISVHVIRDSLIVEKDGERLGVPLLKQISIHGDKNEFVWLPASVVGENYFGGRLKQLTSTSTASDVFGCRDKMRPHLVHTTTWKLGHDELIRQLLKLCGSKVATIEGPVIETKEIMISGSTSSPTSGSTSGPTSSSTSGPSIETKGTQSPNEMVMNICQYVNHLYISFGIEGIKSTLTNLGFLTKIYGEFDNKMIKIKYIDGCQFWKAKWSRQCRGIFLFLNSSDKFVCVKYQLQRGAEICKDTSNMPHYELLDDLQKQTVQKIVNNEPLNGYLSCKSDGCLVSINLHATGSKIAKEISDHIKNHGDVFAKAVDKIVTVMNLPFLPAIGSQNTLFVNEDIHGYVMTSIASSIGFTDEEIKKMASEMKPHELFESIGHLFLMNLLIFYKESLLDDELKSEIMTLSFEAVCKNRTCAWNKDHKELAISYPCSFMKFLGCTFCLGTYDEKIPVGKFKAHFQLEKLIVSTNWLEPIWWKINHSMQIEDMLQDLSKCIDQKEDMDEKKFFTKYKPGNKVVKNTMIDYEGFVFYLLLEDGSLDYSKLKTKKYYEAHKFRLEDLTYFMNCSEHMQTIFPNIGLIKSFFKDLPSKLLNACKDVITECSRETTDNKLFSSLPDKVKASYIKQATTTQIRMLVQISSHWKDIGYNIFVKYFDFLQNEDDVHSLIKSIIMTICKSDEALEKQITDMASDYKKNELIKELLMHQIGKKNIS